MSGFFISSFSLKKKKLNKTIHDGPLVTMSAGVQRRVADAVAVGGPALLVRGAASERQHGLLPVHERRARLRIVPEAAAGDHQEAVHLRPKQPPQQAGGSVAGLHGMNLTHPHTLQFIYIYVTHIFLMTCL